MLRRIFGQCLPFLRSTPHADGAGQAAFTPCPEPPQSSNKSPLRQPRVTRAAGEDPISTATSVSSCSIRPGTELFVAINNLKDLPKDNEARKNAFDSILADALHFSGWTQTKLLCDLMSNIGWLPFRNRLPTIEAICRPETIDKIVDPLSVLSKATEEVKYLAPEDEDFDQPTNDQITALNKIVHVIEKSDVNDPGFVPAIRGVAESIWDTCLCAEMMSFDGNLREAVTHAAGTYPGRDVEGIVDRLDSMLERCPGPGRTASELLAEPDSDTGGGV